MLKSIDFNAPVIEANGKTYRLKKEISINRFRELEKMEVEFYYGFTMQEMFDKLKDAFSDLNKNKLADASVKVYRLMEGVADKVDKRENVMLRMCTLFLCTEDEDLTVWTEDLAKQKIDDWAKEGFAIDDFFTLAANLVPGFINDYEKILAGTLLEEEKNQKKQP